MFKRKRVARAPLPDAIAAATEGAARTLTLTLLPVCDDDRKDGLVPDGVVAESVRGLSWGNVYTPSLLVPGAQVEQSAIRCPRCDYYIYAKASGSWKNLVCSECALHLSVIYGNNGAVIWDEPKGEK